MFGGGICESTVARHDKRINDLIAPYKHIRERFIYGIEIEEADRRVTHRYIGRARDYQRLIEYRRNMKRICQRLPRRKTPGQEKYRTIHFVLYHSLVHEWNIKVHLLQIYPAANNLGLNKEKARYIEEVKPNLNKKHSWSVDELDDFTMEDFVPSS